MPLRPLRPLAPPAQVGCLDAEDVVRPYSCLPYTWDEHTPGRQQRVLLSLPGRRRLGEVELDKVRAAVTCCITA